MSYINMKSRIYDKDKTKKPQIQSEAKRKLLSHHIMVASIPTNDKIVNINKRIVTVTSFNHPYVFQRVDAANVFHLIHKWYLPSPQSDHRANKQSWDLYLDNRHPPVRDESH